MMSERKVISLEEGWDFMQASEHAFLANARAWETPREEAKRDERERLFGATLRSPEHVTSALQEKKKKKKNARGSPPSSFFF